MQSFLDAYMVRSRRFYDDDIHHLDQIFCRTIDLAEQLYGDHLFRPWNPKKGQWASTPQIAFADATMVGCSKMLQHRDALISRREQVLEATKALIQSQPPGTFTGQRNTREAVQNRISAFVEMLRLTLQ
jgi:hypothetical protein